jgi:hypothetical protein
MEILSPMQPKVTSKVIERDFGAYQRKGLRTTVFFGILLLYHLVIIFQGFDMLDEGFHVTFYQQIFNDPSSVQYGFFYWLSGVIGSAVLNFASGLGLWGLRAAGALISVATITMAYQMLRGSVRRDILQISIALLALYINTEPKDIQYNTISSFLYFATFALMMRGLRRNTILWLFLAGIISGLNVFTRIPNLVGTGVGIIILYYGYLESKPLKRQLRELMTFVGGVVLAMAATVWTMRAIGHWQYFEAAIGYLTNMGKTNTQNDGLGGSYGIMKIIYSPFKQYVISIFTIVSLVPVMFGGVYAYRQGEKLGGLGGILLRFIPILLVAVSSALILTDRIELPMLTYFYTGLCLITSSIILLSDGDSNKKVLAAMGLFIMLVHPLASAPGIMTVIIYSMWLSLPLAIDKISSLNYSNIRVHLKANRKNSDFTIGWTKEDLNILYTGMIFLLVLLPMYQLYKKPYFYDYHNRSTLTAPIDNKNTRMIYTSEARAQKVNELLKESGRHVKPGDFVLAYDAIPMYHFLTETKPYLRNPAPMFYTTGIFDIEMKHAQRSLNLPVVVMQQIKTYHEGSSWPEQVVVGDYFTNDRSAGRNAIFNQFLKDNAYRQVWTNGIFAIYLPPGNQGEASNLTETKTVSE